MVDVPEFKIQAVPVIPQVVATVRLEFPVRVRMAFAEFAGVNAFPIILDTQDTEEIIKTIKMIAPTF